MQVKNITPIERHVEKIFLLVGVLFALWLVYRNFVGNPNSVPLPGHTSRRVPPGQVGLRISRAVTRLENRIHSQTSRRFTPSSLPNYVQRLVHKQLAPLPPQLTLLPPVPIGPWNMSVASAPKLHNLHRLIFVVPKVPALVGVKVQQGRGVAVISLHKTRDLVWVKVAARFPMARWRANLKGGPHLKAGWSGLPRAYRRTTFFRVQARREKLLSDGRWGRWKIIHGAYLTPLPKVDWTGHGAQTIPQALSVLNLQVGRILTPAFYRIEQIHLRIFRRQTIRHPARPGQSRRRLPGIPGAGYPSREVPGNAHRFRGAAPRSPSQAPSQAPSGYTSNNGSAIVPSVVPTPGGAAAAGISTLISKSAISVYLYDTGAKPGYRYRYELRVVMYNPAYRFPYRLNDPAAGGRPWLASSWSLPSPVVRVRNSMYFFLAGGNVTRGRVEFQIFKWVHGMWTWGSQTISAGQTIGATESASLIDPQTGRLSYKQVDFHTGYTLVDAANSPSGQSVRAVVRGPHGRLTVRDSAWDNADPQWAKLIKAINQAGSPATSAAGATPPPAVP